MSESGDISSDDMSNESYSSNEDKATALSHASIEQGLDAQTPGKTSHLAPEQPPDMRTAKDSREAFARIGSEAGGTFSHTYNEYYYSDSGDEEQGYETRDDLNSTFDRGSPGASDDGLQSEDETREGTSFMMDDDLTSESEMSQSQLSLSSRPTSPYTESLHVASPYLEDREISMEEDGSQMSDKNDHASSMSGLKPKPDGTPEALGEIAMDTGEARTEEPKLVHKVQDKEELVPLIVKLREMQSDPALHDDLADLDIDERTQEAAARAYNLLMKRCSRAADDNQPVNVSGVTILNLGVVDSRPTYCTEELFYPVGFKCIRYELSWLRHTVVACSCEILDGGDDGPLFKVSVSTGTEEEVSHEDRSMKRAFSRALRGIPLPEGKENEPIKPCPPEEREDSDDEERELRKRVAGLLERRQKLKSDIARMQGQIDVLCGMPNNASHRKHRLESLKKWRAIPDSFFNQSVVRLLEGLPGVLRCVANGYTFLECRPGETEAERLSARQTGRIDELCDPEAFNREKEFLDQKKALDKVLAKYHSQEKSKLLEERRKSRMLELQQRQRERDSEKILRMNERKRERILRDQERDKSKVTKSLRRAIEDGLLKRRSIAKLRVQAVVDKEELQLLLGGESTIHPINEDEVPVIPSYLKERFDLSAIQSSLTTKMKQLSLGHEEVGAVLELWDFMQTFKSVLNLSGNLTTEILLDALLAVERQPGDLMGLRVLNQLACALLEPSLAKIAPKLGIAAVLGINTNSGQVARGMAVPTAVGQSVGLGMMIWPEIARLVLTYKAMSEIGMSDADIPGDLKGIPLAKQGSDAVDRKMVRLLQVRINDRWLKQQNEHSTGVISSDGDDTLAATKPKNIVTAGNLGSYRVRIPCPAPPTCSHHNWQLYIHNVRKMQNPKKIKQQIEKAISLASDPKIVEGLKNALSTEAEDSDGVKRLKGLTLKVLEESEGSDAVLMQNGKKDCEKSVKPNKLEEKFSTELEVQRKRKYTLPMEEDEDALLRKQRYKERAVLAAKAATGEKNSSAQATVDDNSDEDNDDDDASWHGGTPPRNTEPDLATSQPTDYMDMLEDASEMMQRCFRILKCLMFNTVSKYFIRAVDPLKNADYYDWIERPIAFEDIEANLREGSYEDDVVAFARDVRQVFVNAWCYNSQTSTIFACAEKCSSVFERLILEWVLLPQRPPVTNLRDFSCQKCLQENGQDLMICDRCDAHYHLKCGDPELSTFPSGAWFCWPCIHEKTIFDIDPVLGKKLERPKTVGATDQLKDQSETGTIQRLNLCQEEMMYTVRWEDGSETMVSLEEIQVKLGLEKSQTLPSFTAKLRPQGYQSWGSLQEGIPYKLDTSVASLALQHSRENPEYAQQLATIETLSHGVKTPREWINVLSSLKGLCIQSEPIVNEMTRLDKELQETYKESVQEDTFSTDALKLPKALCFKDKRVAPAQKTGFLKESDPDWGSDVEPLLEASSTSDNESLKTEETISSQSFNPVKISGPHIQPNDSETESENEFEDNLMSPSARINAPVRSDFSQTSTHENGTSIKETKPALKEPHVKVEVKQEAQNDETSDESKLKELQVKYKNARKVRQETLSCWSLFKELSEAMGDDEAKTMAQYGTSISADKISEIISQVEDEGHGTETAPKCVLCGESEISLNSVFVQYEDRASFLERQRTSKRLQQERVQQEESIASTHSSIVSAEMKRTDDMMNPDSKLLDERQTILKVRSAVLSVHSVKGSMKGMGVLNSSVRFWWPLDKSLEKEVAPILQEAEKLGLVSVQKYSNSEVEPVHLVCAEWQSSSRMASQVKLETKLRREILESAVGVGRARTLMLGHCQKGYSYWLLTGRATSLIIQPNSQIQNDALGTSTEKSLKDWVCLDSFEDIACVMLLLDPSIACERQLQRKILTYFPGVRALLTNDKQVVELFKPRLPSPQETAPVDDRPDTVQEQEQLCLQGRDSTNEVQYKPEDTVVVTQRCKDGAVIFPAVVKSQPIKDPEGHMLNYRVHFRMWSSRFDAFLPKSLLSQPRVPEDAGTAEVTLENLSNDQDDRQMYLQCLRAASYLERAGRRPRSISTNAPSFRRSKLLGKAFFRVKAALLTIEAALPIGSLHLDASGAQALMTHILEAQTAQELMGALLVLESCLNSRSLLQNQWKAACQALPCWSAALRNATISSISFRIWVLDRSLIYDQAVNEPVSSLRSSTVAKKASQRKKRSLPKARTSSRNTRRKW